MGENTKISNTGILPQNEVLSLSERIKDNHSGITLVPVAEKGNSIIILDKILNFVYFLENYSFEKCYKKQQKEDFIGTINALEKEGWAIL